MALILDTGPLLASLDAADPDHIRCAALFTRANEDLVVPALVLGELDYWCAERLSDYKVPETMDLTVEPLPRNANGKVMKRQLREASAATWAAVRQ